MKYSKTDCKILTYGFNNVAGKARIEMLNLKREKFICMHLITITFTILFLAIVYTGFIFKQPVHFCALNGPTCQCV
jgi:hypothetical protein